jgi:hypothetical protein
MAGQLESEILGGHATTGVLRCISIEGLLLQKFRSFLSLPLPIEEFDFRFVDVAQRDKGTNLMSTSARGKLKVS